MYIFVCMHLNLHICNHICVECVYVCVCVCVCVYTYGERELIRYARTRKHTHTWGNTRGAMQTRFTLLLCPHICCGKCMCQRVLSLLLLHCYSVYTVTVPAYSLLHMHFPLSSLCTRTHPHNHTCTNARARTHTHRHTRAERERPPHHWVVRVRAHTRTHTQGRSNPGPKPALKPKLKPKPKPET
jgi:hypothetical protein